MKKSIIHLAIFLLTFITFNCYSQPLALKIDEKISISIGCGKLGTIYSTEINQVKNLIISKDDKQLSALISTENNTLKLLTIVAIDNIVKQRKIYLTENQLKLISAFKEEKYEVSVCSGCIMQDDDDSTLKEIFNKNTSKLRQRINSALGQN